KYFYRTGSYKWTFETSDLQIEYYDGQTGKTYDKLRDSDTIFAAPLSANDTLLKYEISKNATTISGYKCDRITVVVGRKDDPMSFIVRNIYYSKDLPLNPQKFKAFKVYCTDKVFGLIRAVPLRIEIDTADWPFTMRFEAVKVIKRSI